MIFARLLNRDEDAVICDFAQEYGIYDYTKLPPVTAAILAAGFSSYSRIQKILSGQKHELNTLLLASIADNMALLAWMHTEDGHKNRNRPNSILEKLLVEKDERSRNDLMTFDSGADFDDMWRKIAAQ